ncbi:MAG: hypothetical protein EOP04_00230 [Proteobacteria bacterium]|nr:MAG: hypothetical protein EOP04_00230 [Pseudomonadota bacterium]
MKIVMILSFFLASSAFAAPSTLSGNYKVIECVGLKGQVKVNSIDGSVFTFNWLPKGTMIHIEAQPELFWIAALNATLPPSLASSELDRHIEDALSKFTIGVQNFSFTTTNSSYNADLTEFTHTFSVKGSEPMSTTHFKSMQGGVVLIFNNGTDGRCEFETI